MVAPWEIRGLWKSSRRSRRRLISLVRETSNHLAFRLWSQDQLRQSVQLLVSQLKLKAGEIDLCASPLHLLGNLAAGLTSMIGSRSDRSLDHQVEKFKPTRTAADSPVVRRLLRKPFSPFHRVFITDAPLEPRDVDYFTGRMQHANIELIFYEDLPLASLPLKEYERKGSATLVGSFYSTVEARVSVHTETGKSAVRRADPTDRFETGRNRRAIHSRLVPAEPANAWRPPEGRFPCQDHLER